VIGLSDLVPPQTPPDAPNPLDVWGSLADGFTAGFEGKMLDLLPWLIPAVLVRVGLGVFMWWLDRRAQLRKGIQLELF
jgi:hypothetical protein